MAIIIPNIEKAKTSKQQPTEGEVFLLQYLESHFGDDVEVYFQPCFNGDRPDVVVISKNLGLIIFEVKDWNLKHYEIDEENQWLLKSNHTRLRSPFQQVYTYKKNFFDIHINGLLEKNIINPNFFKIIKTYVYFHGSSKAEVDELYEKHVSRIYNESVKNESDLKNNLLNFDRYERRRLYLEQIKYKFERDKSTVSITKDRLKKICFPINGKNILFEESVYLEFLRLLAPPFHYATDGKELIYSVKQEKLIHSSEGARQKICGLAGSGKTIVLAARAVDAHKRHNGKVLILTYNITLCSYIHDKVSAVRFDFPWSAFEFSNYHRFITMALNNSGLEIIVPSELKYDGDDYKVARKIADQRDEYLESKYYSNEKIFKDKEIKTKYETILIDEIQDYKPEWIKLLRANFLEEDGEMILFGDERQNIYGRALDGERRSKVVEGFGNWSKLTKSFRYKESSPIIPLAEEFQNAFLNQTYDVDRDESYQMSLSMVGILAYRSYEISNIESLACEIIDVAKKNKIHPNDISIISSQEMVLQKLDHCFRNSDSHREKTLCTFPSLEAKQDARYSSSYQKLSASKKKGFNLNSGVMKLSSTHSFKGFESPFVFLIVHDGDTPEMVLTGLTRAKENIIVYINKNNKFFDFFASHLANVSTVLN